MYARLHPARRISSETAVVRIRIRFIKNLHYFSFFLGLYITLYHYYNINTVDSL